MFETPNIQAYIELVTTAVRARLHHFRSKLLIAIPRLPLLTKATNPMSMSKVKKACVSKLQLKTIKK